MVISMVFIKTPPPILNTEKPVYGYPSYDNNDGLLDRASSGRVYMERRMWVGMGRERSDSQCQIIFFKCPCCIHCCYPCMSGIEFKKYLRVFVILGTATAQ